MSEKGQVRKSMFSVQNMEELRRLYDSDTPVLAYAFTSACFSTPTICSTENRFFFIGKISFQILPKTNIPPGSQIPGPATFRSGGEIKPERLAINSLAF
jgi:hypothetical protein